MEVNPLKYQMYELEFTTEVHFGKTSLEDAEISFHADTLFSALCQEAIKLGELNKLVTMAKNGNLLFSDAFPRIGKECYIPKPLISSDKLEEVSDIKEKKKYKKLQYIPVEYLDQYLNGSFPEEKFQDLNDLGQFHMKTAAAIRGFEEAQPYRVKGYSFREGNGLYIIVGCEKLEDFKFLENLLEYLSYTGLGGKRSSGFGRFECRKMKMPSTMEKGLTERKKYAMLMSLALPKDEELEDALQGASYQLVKKSGFVASDTYAPQQMRKKDLYVFKAGSCFQHSFQGDLWDVSEAGMHPVYRYAKGMFLGVDA